MSVCNKVHCSNNSWVATPSTTYLVDIHAHTLEDHHHRGLIDSSSFLVKSIKTFLQRIHLVQKYLSFSDPHDITWNNWTILLQNSKMILWTQEKLQEKKKLYYVIQKWHDGHIKGSLIRSDKWNLRVGGLVNYIVFEKRLCISFFGPILTANWLNIF